MGHRINDKLRTPGITAMPGAVPGKSIALPNLPGDEADDRRTSPQNRKLSTCHGLRFALDLALRCFWALPLTDMAKTPKELAFLGGTFLVGLGALEVCLRFGGF